MVKDAHDTGQEKQEPYGKMRHTLYSGALEEDRKDKEDPDGEGVALAHHGMDPACTRGSTRQACDLQRALCVQSQRSTAIYKLAIYSEPTRQASENTIKRAWIGAELSFPNRCA